MLLFPSSRVRLLAAALSLCVLLISPAPSRAESVADDVPAITPKHKPTHKPTAATSKKKTVAAPKHATKTTVVKKAPIPQSVSPAPAGQIDLTPVPLPSAPATTPSAQAKPAEPANFITASPTAKIPVCAMINLESETLSSPEMALLSQTVWNEVQRTRRTYLRTREWTRQALESQDLTPTDPYRVPPSRQDMAKALQADFLIMGNANGVGRTYVIELMLYSLADNSVVRSEAAQSDDGLNGLLTQIPRMVVSLQSAIPVQVAQGSPAAAVVGRPADDFVYRRINELERENERLRKEIAELKGQAPASGKAARKTPKLSARKTNVEEAVAAAEAKVKQQEAPAEAAIAEKPAGVPAETKSAQPVATVAPSATVPKPSPTPEPTPSAETPPAAETPEQTNEQKAKAKFDEAVRFPTTSEQGIKPLEEAVRLDPGNAEYQSALVTRLYYTKQYGTCVKRGEEFLKRGATDSAVFIFVAAAYTSLNENAKALAILDRALKVDPNNGYALFNRALNLDQMKDPRAAEAFRYYLKVARSDPKQAQWVSEAERILQELESKEKPAGEAK